MANKSTLTIILLIAALIASNWITVQAFTVDSIVKPSVPEFTVQIVSHPYDVPPKTTTTIDQYTGKETTTTIPGYRVENKSIEIKIKNQPFTPYNLTQYTYYHRNFDKDGSVDGSYTVDGNKAVKFYFNIQVKGHFGESWVPVGERYVGFEGPEPNVQRDSPYTVISIGDDYPEGTMLDFRVQARIGYYHAYGPGIAILGYDFYGQESGWSNIQTLNLDNTQVATSTPTITVSPTVSPTELTPTTEASPTATPVHPETHSESELKLTLEQLALVVTCTVIVVLAVALLFLWRKKV